MRRHSSSAPTRKDADSGNALLIEPKRRRLAPHTRLVKRERAIADHASAFRRRVALIAKIEQPHLELTLARYVHEPVYADAAARLLTAEFDRAV